MTKSTCRSPVRRAGLLAIGATVLALLAAPFAGLGAAVGDPGFRAILIDGKTAQGRLAALNSTRVILESDGGKRETIPWNRLVALERDRTGRVIADRQQVVLPRGDVLAQVTVGSTSDSGVVVQSDVLGKLVLPIESVQGLILGAQHEAEAEALRERIVREPRRAEIAWLTNGDAVAGGFAGLSDTKVTMRVENRTLQLDRSGVAAIAMDPSLTSYPGKQCDAEMLLRDGSRLSLAEPAAADGALSARTLFGQPIRVNLEEIVRLRARTPAVVYLTERTPVRTEDTPYLGPAHPFRADRTVNGFPLMLGGQLHDRGLGTSTRAFLAYKIEPGDRRFQALVGVDERAGSLGSVLFRVLVDRREAYRGKHPMSDRDPPEFVDADLTGGRFLILVADYGDRGNIRDLADWTEARIIRSK